AGKGIGRLDTDGQRPDGQGWLRTWRVLGRSYHTGTLPSKKGGANMEQLTVVQPTAEVPEPGLYPDVPADVYHRWPAASQTVLKIMRDRSPAHARQYMLTPPEPTPAMVLGAAIHAAILQPDVFARQYVRAPELDRRTRAGREAWEQLETE